MTDVQALGQQPVLRFDHVAVAVVRKAGVQPVARLAGVAVADAVGEHDEVLRGIERLTRREELARKFRSHETRTAPSGAVQDEDRVMHHAVGVRARCTEGAIVDAQLRERLAGGESEVLEEEVALHRRRIARLRPGRNRPRERSGGGRREPGGREPYRDALCRAARGDSPPPTHALRLVSHSPTTRSSTASGMGAAVSPTSWKSRMSNFAPRRRRASARRASQRVCPTL